MCESDCGACRHVEWNSDRLDEMAVSKQITLDLAVGVNPAGVLEASGSQYLVIGDLYSGRS
jgi:hypothetical protein